MKLKYYFFLHQIIVSKYVIPERIHAYPNISGNRLAQKLWHFDSEHDSEKWTCAGLLSTQGNLHYYSLLKSNKMINILIICSQTKEKHDPC